MNTRLLSQIVLGVAILASVVGGIFLLTRPSSGGVEIILPTATPVQIAEVGVYITGAVQNPGVYTLLEGDRLIRAIEIAGGSTREADLTAINLATRLQDEDHWHIPEVGEAPQITSTQATSSRGEASAAKIDLNTADVEQFKTLPGIGDVRAQAIVSYRDANGPFATVEDLLAIRGIGTATLDSIRELIEVR